MKVTSRLGKRERNTNVYNLVVSPLLCQSDFMAIIRLSQS